MDGGSGMAPNEPLWSAGQQERAVFSIERRREGGTTRLILHGELDLAGREVLREALNHEERSREALVVVLDQLDYLDSVGIAELVDSSRRARRDGRRFSVSAGTGNARRVLWISGVLDHLSHPVEPWEPSGAAGNGTPGRVRTATG
jgi:anti-anti-sigma factor